MFRLIRRFEYDETDTFVLYDEGEVFALERA
jgi:hypothetical protein